MRCQSLEKGFKSNLIFRVEQINNETFFFVDSINVGPNNFSFFFFVISLTVSQNIVEISRARNISFKI